MSIKNVGLGAGRNATGSSAAACDDAHDRDGVGNDVLDHQRGRNGLHAVHGLHGHGRNSRGQCLCLRKHGGR